MKTTLEFPEPLFRKLKATAALSGKSLKEFVTEAVKNVADKVCFPDALVILEASYDTCRQRIATPVASSSTSGESGGK